MTATQRTWGRSLQPNIENVRLPFGSQYLLEPDSVVLDTATGYGCDIARVKQMFPDSEACGIDLNLVMSAEVFDGKKFSYGRARQVVKRALGEDVLPKCHIRQGDALKLREYFGSDCFDRLLSYGLIHHLPRGKRNKSFEQAYAVLQEGGILNAKAVSGVNLAPFSEMKGKYNWSRVRESLPDDSPNTGMDTDERARFKHDLMTTARRYGLHPSEEDWRRIEQVAGSPDSFYVSDLTPETIDSDLRKTGFRDVAVEPRERPGSIIHRIAIYARK